MQISELRSRVSTSLVEWAWDQWAQLGVDAWTTDSDEGAMDPEALLLFTFQIARADPRLFDEVLDWLTLNERLVSAQRLRNLCRDSVDRSLADAALAWVAQARKRGEPRTGGSGRQGGKGRGEPLFPQLSVEADRGDPTYQAYGWFRPPTERRGKSRAPNTLAPINFAFRLRQILGVGARAEVVRFLVTADESRPSAQVIADAAGYAKRNVHDALVALHDADVLEAGRVGNEQRYEIDRARWGALLNLAPEGLPRYRDWRRLLPALVQLSRWLDDPRHDAKSEYMLASDARQLAEQTTPDLRHAGVRISRPTQTGADYWQDFVALVDAAVAALDADGVSTAMSNESRCTAADRPVAPRLRSPESLISTGTSGHRSGRAGGAKAGS